MSLFYRREFLEERGLVSCEAHVTSAPDGCEMGIEITDTLNAIQFCGYDRLDFDDRSHLDRHIAEVQLLYDILHSYLVAAHDERDRMQTLAAMPRQEILE